MKKCMRLAMAVVVLTAAANAQDGKPQDPDLEKRIQKLLEQKKRDQEQAQKEGAKQGAETTEQSVARAKLLADSEHDYEKALALAESVAGDEKVASEVRGRALVVAARSLVQLGRANDAQNRLRVALGFGGPAADEARRLLDAGQTDQQLELRIAKAIEEIFGGANANSEAVKPGTLAGNQTARDLIWVGAPAVPRLAKVLADVDHLANVSGAAFLLGNIGTKDAADAIRVALQRPDPLYRRAVLRGFESMTDPFEHATFWSSPAREAAVSLRLDRDPGVRKAALVEQSPLMKLDEILAPTSDADDAVRVAAWQALQWRLNNNRSLALTDTAILPALRRCLKEDHDAVRTAAASLFSTTPFLRDPEGRELALESMLDPVLTGPDVQDLPGWMSSYNVVEAQNWTLPRPIPIDLLVRLAERFGQGRRFDVSPSPRDTLLSLKALSAWIGASSNARVDGHLGWPASDRAAAWRLLRFGLGASFLDWAQANATAEDLPTIVDFAIEAENSGFVWNLVEPKVKTLTDDQRQAVGRSLARIVETRLSTLDRADKYQLNSFSMWCHSLLAFGSDAGDELLIRIASGKTVFPDAWITTQLLTRPFPVVELRHLAQLVTLPSLRQSSEEFRARNDALGRLAAAHSPELPSILAACYSRGINGREVVIRGRQSVRPHGFLWLVARDFGGDEATATRLDDERRSSETAPRRVKFDVAAAWAPSYSETEVREAFEACARLGDSSFWYDVRYAVMLLPESGPYDPIAAAVLELATRLVPTAPLESNGNPPTVVYDLLLRRAPGWEDLALLGASDSRWRAAILNGMQQVTPGLLDRVSALHDSGAFAFRTALVSRLANEKDPAIRARAAGFLKDESADVRAAAISATIAIDSAHALDLVLPLAKDEKSSVRIALCKELGAVFDRRVIPVLVDLLKDPSDGVRDVAKKSLDSLQYTLEQEQKWKRVLEGAGLDSSNAAEALIKQAAAGQPKATRLVAIESLGTLGVAETLPVLIQFMGDGDAEVAAAAKEAVARINRQSKAGKDAGDAKAGKDGKPPSDH
jgi:HEAT repeat protein